MPFHCHFSSFAFIVISKLNLLSLNKIRGFIWTIRMPSNQWCLQGGIKKVKMVFTTIWSNICALFFNVCHLPLIQNACPEMDFADCFGIWIKSKLLDNIIWMSKIGSISYIGLNNQTNFDYLSEFIFHLNNFCPPLISMFSAICSSLCCFSQSPPPFFSVCLPLSLFLAVPDEEGRVCFRITFSFLLNRLQLYFKRQFHNPFSIIFWKTFQI